MNSEENEWRTIVFFVGHGTDTPEYVVFSSLCRPPTHLALPSFFPVIPGNTAVWLHYGNPPVIATYHLELPSSNTWHWLQVVNVLLVVCRTDVRKVDHISKLSWYSKRILRIQYQSEVYQDIFLSGPWIPAGTHTEP